MIKAAKFQNKKKKDWFSHKTGAAFVNGEVFKEKSGNSPTFMIELFATITNSKKLQRVLSDMQQDSSI